MLLPSWPGLASRSVAFKLPVFRGSSYDLPACLGDSGRDVQFLVKEDKTRQTKKEALVIRRWQCLFSVLLSG